MTIEEAIAKLNVLSSYDTAAEKREEYKQCINAILKDLEVLEIFKKFDLDISIYQNGDGKWQWYVYTEYNNIIITEEEAKKLKEWKKRSNNEN